MRLSAHLKRYVQSFVPGTYRKLTVQSTREHLSHLFVVFWIILALMLIVGAPRLFTLPGRIAEGLGAFEEFTLSANVSMREPLTVSALPLVVIDLDKENITDERLLINEQGVEHKGWFSQRSYEWESLRRVSSYAPKYSSWLFVLSLLFLPSLIVALLLLAAIEVAVLTLVTLALGLVISRLAHLSISAKQLVKVSLIACAPALSVQLIPFFYIRWLVVPLVFFVLLVVAGSAMVGQRRDKRATKDVP